MRSWVLGALTIALLQLAAGPALADPAGAYGNTLQITRPDGSTIRFYINADGTYTGVWTDGSAISGTWAETNGQMCFTQTSPAAAAASCGPLITQNAGDAWTAQRPDGSVSQLTIIQGR